MLGVVKAPPGLATPTLPNTQAGPADGTVSHRAVEGDPAGVGVVGALT